MSDRQRFLVVLQAEGSGPPVETRLRRWLKASLRGYGLRATSVQEIAADAPSVSARAGARTTPNPPTAAV